MSQVVKLPNHQLAAYLDQVGAAGVFSRYVIARQPDAESLAVVENGRVVGTAVAGSSVGLFEAYSHWIFAGSPEAALLLAQATRNDSPALNFPLSYLDQVQATYPQHQISVDRLYVLPQSRFHAARGAAPVQRIDAAALQMLDVPAELQPLIGAADAWTGDYTLHGIVLQHTLVCIGETIVQDQHYGAIQQIYTLPAYRGRSLAQQLVSACCDSLLAQHKLPIYVAAEDNLPSRHLAEKLGFLLDSRYGYLV
ncbi:MAG: GNAT family N-acetyltransferase [Chloroflexi bacterium]|nr:GNAT family N-acetyltransferase [Chloroflexota bacterium]